MACFPIQSLNTFLSSCYLGWRCCTVWLAHSWLLAAQVVDLELEAQAEAPCQFRPFSICLDSDFHEFYRNFNFLTLLLGLISIDHCNKNYFWGIGGQAAWPLPVCAYESSHLMGCIWIQDKSKSHSCPVLAVLNPRWWFYPTKNLPKHTNNLLNNWHNVTEETTQGCGLFSVLLGLFTVIEGSTLLVSVSKTAALFITRIGMCFCWFPWWYQLFDLYDVFFFFLFIWATNDQNVPHAVVAGTTWKWPFGSVCSMCF